MHKRLDEIIHSRSISIQCLASLVIRRQSDHALCYSQLWRGICLHCWQECTFVYSIAHWQCIFRVMKYSYALKHNNPVFIICSVQFSHSVVSDSLRPHELQHARPPCLSPAPGVHSNPCPLSQWCHPTILSSVVPFSSCSQSFPASGSFPMSQLFAWDGQSIGVSASASVLPMNTRDWSPLGWTGWISLQSKGYKKTI